MSRAAIAMVACWPALAAAQPRAVAVAGDVEDMAVTVDGRALRLPAVDVALEAGPDDLVPGTSDNLRRRDNAAIRFRAGVRWVSGVPSSWRLVLRQVLPRPRPVRVLGGTGAPGAIAWDGLDDGGRPVSGAAVYEAQLQVAGADSIAASPWRRFGIAWSLEPRGSGEKTIIRGDLFAGDPMKPQATPELGRAIMGVARKLGRDDLLLVEVHEDGTGDRLEKQAATQKQAELVRLLFRAAGIDPLRVRARGRGNTEPLAPARTIAQRQENRRLVVTVIAGPPGAGPVPIAAPGAPAVTVGGTVLAPSAGGRFRGEVPYPGDRRLRLELAAADGRSLTTSTLVAGAPPPPIAVRPPAVHAPARPAPAPRPAAPRPAAAPPASVRASLSPPPPRPRPMPGVGVALGEPLASLTTLTLRPVVPETLEVSDWQLDVWAGDSDEGEPATRLTGSGRPPESVSWDHAGSLHAVRLRISAADGTRGESRLHVINRGLFPPPGGPLFSAIGEPQKPLRQAVAILSVLMMERPVGERYRLEMTAVMPADFSPNEVRLALWARAGRVRALLEAAGADLDRVDVEVRAAADAVPAHERLLCSAVRAVEPRPLQQLGAITFPKLRDLKSIGEQSFYLVEPIRKLDDLKDPRGSPPLP